MPYLDIVLVVAILIFGYLVTPMLEPFVLRFAFAAATYGGVGYWLSKRFNRE